MKNLAQKIISTRSTVASLFFISLSLTVQAQQSQMKMDGVKTTGQEMKQVSYTIPQKPEDISPLLIGEKIPTVNILDATGKSFNLNKAVAEKPTVLIFYRGGWCPYCSKQLSGLQDIAPDLEKLGYQIIAISTDQPEGLMQSATKEKLSYTLLSDADLVVSKQFGIAFKAPKGYWEMLPKTTGGKNIDLLLPVPSVFILDKKGTIHFEYINPDFKQRLNPELLKSVAQNIINDL
ncbi:peroxiredoxin-like family protein [Chryseobacterium paridis]|uniref:thioredoxin-dependent peroxiredoxin n=1 Tax=Chryseobacterium paridis TaxID=2800328 RepID=A0ABS1FY55_9FLAO|nr:peroxiredoxin-like family protein [Chryseobacterium paridis]MBK1897330.1 AhpC/TSA family protein [Chryseobacterium paridis]